MLCSLLSWLKHFSRAETQFEINIIHEDIYSAIPPFRRWH